MGSMFGWLRKLQFPLDSQNALEVPDRDLLVISAGETARGAAPHDKAVKIVFQGLPELGADLGLRRRHAVVPGQHDLKILVAHCFDEALRDIVGVEVVHRDGKRLFRRLEERPQHRPAGVRTDVADNGLLDLESRVDRVSGDRLVGEAGSRSRYAVGDRLIAHQRHDLPQRVGLHHADAIRSELARHALFRQHAGRRLFVGDVDDDRRLLVHGAIDDRKTGLRGNKSLDRGQLRHVGVDHGLHLVLGLLIEEAHRFVPLASNELVAMAVVAVCFQKGRARR